MPAKKNRKRFNKLIIWFFLIHINLLFILLEMLNSGQILIVLALVGCVSVSLASPLQEVSYIEQQGIFAPSDLKQHAISAQNAGYAMDGTPGADNIKVVSVEQIIPLVAGTLGPAAPFVQPMLSAIVPLTNVIRPIVNRVALQMLTSLFNSLSPAAVQNGTDARANDTITSATTPTGTASEETSITTEIGTERDTDSAAEGEDEEEDEENDEFEESKRMIADEKKPVALGNFGSADRSVARTLNDVTGTLEEFLREQMQKHSTHIDEGPEEKAAHEKLKKSHGKLLAFKNSLKKMDFA